MPDVLESGIWCAALATWLLLLWTWMAAILGPLFKTIKRDLELRRLKAKGGPEV